MTSEWWTYRLSDLLLFSPKTYYRLFELYNREVWPAHLVAMAGGLIILVRLVRLPGSSQRMLRATLGVAWMWIAWGFLLRHYATINWAAKWFAAAFAVEALLLIGSSLPRAGLEIAPRNRFERPIGLAFFVFALLVEPLVGIAVGRSWMQAELFALAPDPTAVATLGMLLFLGHSRRLPLVIPLLWCAVSGATLWAMKASDALVLPVVAVVAIAISICASRLRRTTRV